MRILIADDHLLFLDMLSSYLSTDDTLSMQKSGTLHGALQLIDGGGHYDLVILDHLMPGMHGLHGLKRVLKAPNVAHVALMTGEISKSEARAAIDIGASGIISKSVSAEYFTQTLKYLAVGGRHLPEDIGPEEVSSNPYFENLSKRETEILRELATGKTNRIIANELGIRETTVKQFVTLLNKKLNVRNRTQAALLARDYGLV